MYKNFKGGMKEYTINIHPDGSAAIARDYWNLCKRNV